ncbi:MAG: DNA primase [Rhodobacteraceae bacterium]|nr:MAG: DNA primase [Paracoccaceae bacterium]
MRLPDGFLDDLHERTSIAQVVGRKVMWDNKKSNPGKGDMWAPCPFHQEKTASFHVDDRKGFYYCFGCHAKGSAIGFVQETENVSFMEAVEILAREVGMPMPKSSPQEQQRADTRKTLADVMEQAVKFYRLQLHSAKAAEARAYLEKRGLPESTLERFEIGFASDARTALFEALTAKNIPAEQIIEAGLCIKPDDGGKPYDRFRGRIMFPIRDARGRCIAFGGRAMDPNARAKYLNSNETPLFDKGRSLYNHGPAREASGKANALIVAEGYMDVIALAQAGFNHSVAPLGTAITENQLAMIWRICPEPVIALDGDNAGIQAARRLIDLALPLLEAGKSLRFCILPEGLDPDDLIRAQGAEAMQKLLDNAQPMVDLLWQRETEGKIFDSPERRTALDASLRKTIQLIKDPNLRGHYGAAINERRQTLFAPARKDTKPWQGNSPRQSGKPWGNRAPSGPTPSAKSSMLAQSNAGPETDARVRECAILLGCINHPHLAEKFETRLERAHFLAPDLQQIRDALLSSLAETPHQPEAEQREYLIGRIQATLGFEPLAKLLSIGQVRANPYLRSGADIELATQAIDEELAKHAAILGIVEEIKDAEEEITGVADEGLTWRLQQARETQNKISHESLGGDSAGVNDESGLSKSLQKLIDQKIWEKKKH